MGRRPWAVYLWPGLPEIWGDGRWSALAWAVAFAVLVNLAVAGSLLWTELFATATRIWLWAAVVVFWSASALVSCVRDVRQPLATSDPGADTLFAEATEHYLKGEWFEAESLLRAVLGKNPRDIEAGLMLATLLRRTGRTAEACRELQRLDRFDTADGNGNRSKWKLEIRREWDLLREAGRQKDNDSASAAAAGPAESSPRAEMGDAA